MAMNKEGVTLGAYRIISQIGKGGMATVYKAYQASMDRYVALKVLPQYHSKDPSFTQRFIQEAHTIARLEHKNILPVYDFGEEEGVAYMAMRYLDGGTLQDILSLGQLPLSEVVEIMSQICAGLDYAHRHGVVHRDIKPANVMIDDEGGVYLTDFGLAKVLEGSSDLTVSGVVMGTPLYMAPEQSVGDAVDERADIYAAGVILYEMVTGQPPFQAETPMAIVLAHLHDPLPLPKEVNPNVPDEIQRIILKALAKKPEDRYQTAKEMAEKLSETIALMSFSANATTLQFLSSEARASVKEKTILPSDANFTPVSAQSSTTVIPSPSRAKIVVSIVSAVALVAIATFLGMIFLRGNTRKAKNTHPAMPSSLYDDFNDSEFDGNLNTRIWHTDIDPACFIEQKNGELIVSNEKVDYDMDTCDMIVGVPEEVRLKNLEDIKARIFLEKGYEGDGGQSIMYSVDFPNGEAWYGLCGAEATDGEAVASFWTAHIMANDTSLEDYYASAEIQVNEWHSYHLKIDHEAGILSCFLDDNLIGSTVLEDSDQFNEASFRRGITAWRNANATATTKVDGFWLNP
ncbi:MAG: hypothetical protein DRI32_00620 [Chloroflexi bacterium]|nr:MAG: hypothetical protein DRI32_00620 [Chloroflexota bacterium]